MPVAKFNSFLVLCCLACAGYGRRTISPQAATATSEASDPVQLDFEDLTFKIGNKVILDACSGKAAPGRMLAIMGPSGSGKTTLLNALAGQLKGGSKASLTGRLLVDGEQFGGVNKVPGLRVAYVRQEDTFYKQMTVRETLLFTASLRLPSSIPFAVKERRVDELIATLGLDKAADTIVGDSARRGISGGERKRLAIGCELISEPQLLFLDEPTSGLDSFAAQQVVNLLKRLADGGTTIVMAIHQPRGSIFNLFDDLLLLSEGRVMYNGPAPAAKSHFAALGHTCPSNINAGEFVVDLVSKGYQPELANARLSNFETAARKQQQLPASSNGKPRVVQRRFRSSLFTQFRLLLKRAWREVARSPVALAIKAMQQMMIALIYGGIYTLGNGQSSIRDRFGLLSLMAIGAGNMGIVSTIRAFPKEKLIVNSERAKGMYSVLPYFLSKVLAEAPVAAGLSALGGAALYPLAGLNPAPGKFMKYLSSLVLEGLASGALGLLMGAMAPNTEVALAMFPPILVLNIVFNGFNIAAENVPKCLRWIPKVSFIRWCFQGLVANEFAGLEFESDRRGPCSKTGEEALQYFALGDYSCGDAAIAQTKLLGACYFLTLYMLQRSSPKFLSIESKELAPEVPKTPAKTHRSPGVTRHRRLHLTQKAR